MTSFWIGTALGLIQALVKDRQGPEHQEDQPEMPMDMDTWVLQDK